jgi:hypothetical protein
MAFVWGFWKIGVPGTGSDSASPANTLNMCLLGHGNYTDFPAPATYVSVSSPGNVGMMALADDRQIIYYSNGTTWIPCAVACDGTPASGDTLYFNGTKFTRLAKDSDGKGLVLVSGLPSWQSVALHLASSTYSGDGTNSRQITVGFIPKLVIITGGNAAYTFILLSATVGQNEKHTSNSPYHVACTGTYLHASDGFVVSQTGDAANQSSQTYSYFAIG